MKEPSTGPKRKKRRTKRRTKSASTKVTRITALRKPPQVNAASVAIQNIYFHGFDERNRSFKIDRKMLRHLLRIETLSADAIAALVRNLKKHRFLMSSLDATPNEWVVDRIDPAGLPAVTEDVIREAEERALDLS